MGMKVEIENYFSGDYSMRDVSRETNGSGWASCYSDMNMPNGGKFYYGFAPKTISDLHPGYESYDKDVVKQTMLKHEVVFKDQVYELHRLYRVQRDLMDEVRRKEQYKQYTLYEASSSSGPLPSDKQLEDAQKWNGSNSVRGKSVLVGPSVYQNSYSPKNSEVSESRPTKFRKQMIDLQLPADEYIDTDDTEEFCRKNDFEKTREISSENGKKALADLNEPFCVKGNSQDRFYCASESEHCKPDFRTANHGIHPDKAHIMPDQACHPPAFLTSDHINKEPWKRKSDHAYSLPSYTIPEPSQLGLCKSNISGLRPASTHTSPFDLNKWNLNNTPEANAVFDNDPPLRNGFYQGSSSRDLNLPCEPIDINHSSGHEEILPRKRKNYFDINVPCEPIDEEVDVVDQRESKSSERLINRFDLNSCVMDEEIPCETSKVNTGIDLESTPSPENEDIFEAELEEIPCETSKVNTGIDLESTPSPENEDIFEAELIKLAASSIVEISSRVIEEAGTFNFPLLEASEGDDDDPLNWFVSIACSSGSNPQPSQNDGLDDFENMILRLKECKPEDYFPSPSTPDLLFTENVLTTRTRRGPGRRAKQRRDFQRDILPGLTTLSRHDVTEDLQIFGGLMRATGYSLHSAPNRTRNRCGRGRRKSVVETPPISITVCALPLKLPVPPPHEVVVEVGLEERSLTGWGKTTRRPRRQRCASGNCTLPLHLS